MIRITKGFFIWFDGRRRRIMEPGDGPFTADKALEARLVSEGVAEYVGAEANEPQTLDAEATEYVELTDMTRAELVELAEKYGIKAGKLSKAKLIEHIEQAEDMVPDIAAAEVE